MAGTIVVDRIESDSSYTSTINVASNIVFSGAISGNVNISSSSLLLGSARSANTSTAAIEISGTGSRPQVGVLIRNTSNTGYSGLRLYNDKDSVYNSLEIDYFGSAYPGTAINNGPSGEQASIATVGAFPVAIGTNNTARLVIDGSGRVTKQYQPAFKAYPSTNISQAGGALSITFNTTVYNIGSHYNTSTGRFTAPVAGIYIFEASTYLANAADGYHGIRWLVNDNLQQDAYVRGGFGDVTPAFAFTTQLAANDNVRIQTYNSASVTVYLGVAASHFSGYLLG